ncbi:methionine--tRNA ligase [bacterium]|jgi:methionyl-tRNA synthetase|nr:methionine--tRNA ligase [bacterium]
MNKKDKFYVTTPLYYVTSEPHLGSLYSTVLADILARWNKVSGKQVFFLTGSDEHGQKIMQAAQKVGKEPKEFVDSFIESYKTLWKKYDIDYNKFIRTTDDYHVKAVQSWISDLIKKGDIYKSFYKGWYCTPCESYLTDNDVSESRKKGNNVPLCTVCERETAELQDESYFFKLSKYQDKLLDFYKKNPNFVVPKERLAEVVSFVKSGLKDLSISRTNINWGVPFPGDDKHVTYVWADALNNYITGIGYGQKNKQEEFKKWWPADCQIMGKDILRFHAVYWPAFLMASDLEPPKNLLIHGWITVSGKKMSKSRSNVVEPNELLSDYGADSIRYYLSRYMAITQDSDFDIDDLEKRLSTDLANDLGNLLNRVIILAEKNDCLNVKPAEDWSEESKKLQENAIQAIQLFTKHMNEFYFHIALSHVWKFINQVNAYFHDQEPWKQAKLDKKQFAQIISATCHSLYTISVLLWPVMPKKMSELLGALSVHFDSNALEFDVFLKNEWNNTFTLKKIEPIFKKYVSKKKDSSVQEEGKEEVKKDEYISIEDLAKVELCVGTITKCDEIEGSDKLFKLLVDFGPKGERQILAGVKKFYDAQDLIGKQGVFVINLKPRKIMGIESCGMMFVAEDEKKTMQFITVSGPVLSGQKLR